MDKKIYKKTFTKVALDYKFTKFKEVWIQEFHNCFVRLDLQKSNYSNIYYLNVGIIEKKEIYSKEQLAKIYWHHFASGGRIKECYDLDLDLSEIELEILLAKDFELTIKPLIIEIEKGTSWKELVDRQMLAF